MVLNFLGVGFQVYSQRVCCKENRSLCYKYICHGTHIKKNVAFLSQNHNRAYLQLCTTALHHDFGTHKGRKSSLTTDHEHL